MQHPHEVLRNDLGHEQPRQTLRSSQEPNKGCQPLLRIPCDPNMGVNLAIVESSWPTQFVSNLGKCQDLPKSLAGEAPRPLWKTPHKLAHEQPWATPIFFPRAWLGRDLGHCRKLPMTPMSNLVKCRHLPKS